MAQKRNLLQRVVRRLSGHQGAVDERIITEALAYIEDYWPELTCEHKDDQGTIIGLPNPFILPANDHSSKFTFQEQYYWDSYFNALALVGTDRQYLAEGMLENLIYLFKRFHYIPNASRMYHMSHSQPPILTSFIRLIYETGHKDTQWLKEHMAVAQDEYQKVWMNENHPFWHQVWHGLSRYYDINMLHDLAEAESGWDMTPRFERKCLDYLPIDLNCLLFKYEMDFAWAARLLDEDTESKHWLKTAEHRKQVVNKYMWHKRRGFFFDYNYAKGQIGDSWSLAAYFAMWSGLATRQQSERMVRHLDKFEYKGGLVTTTRPLIDMNIFGSLKTQWAFPNGWAPLQWVVIQGLRDYGFDVAAERVTRKWLYSNLLWFERHGHFLEKYNVVNPAKHPVEGLYPSQTGFGWTNSIFVCLARDYVPKD